MAQEEIEKNIVPPLCRPPPFLEVLCKSSGIVRRFAAGTEAVFALSLINRKLGPGVPLALHIEAIKEGEEPVGFGPNSLLVDYGEGWRLQTVTEAEEGPEMGRGSLPALKQIPTVIRSERLDTAKQSTSVSTPPITLLYIGKIFLAFIFIFILGAILTLFLESLPRLILIITSFM
ncbi:PREDICTED: uncharacterized protein LOC104604156 [Nelumbo nucifera]|uniref:Uncharacterized protein LOC104604156 n=1 Tax=Nelumbo nucifera TaxID=4432 RepID=A0A1U8AU71_NELNU|nr:PREDICTED: uncharacterized protein LOC104604156 [Nelumbo nucifera]XP_010266714.1 PREDICTED: uncharacterized protein LOC104604156 [Nelumbo nucifera]XP_010266715.1 PREDICTED: uncharacterized protein LOC104604156 [Nelumbo nucifera]